MSHTIDLQSASPAFRAALLKSERFRVRVILATLALFFAERTIRTLLVHGPEDVRLWNMTATIMGVFAVYELVMLRGLLERTRMDKKNFGVRLVFVGLRGNGASGFGDRVSHQQRDQPPISTAGESSRIGIFIFIILSTLRLNPWDCWIAGLGFPR